MQETKKPLLVISVDVEALPARAQSEHVQKLIWGNFGGPKNYGMHELMDEAERVGAKLTCLLDYAEEELYGSEIDEVAKTIIDRKHDLQLHLHPEILPPKFWERMGREKPNVAPNRWDEETSKAAFEYFVQKFKNIKGKVPDAFRAGSFRSNPGQISAMGDLGISISSNQATSVYQAQNREPSGNPLDSIMRHFNGVYELPLTQIPTRDAGWANLEFPWRGRAEDKPETCFYKLSRDGRPIHVLLLHSWVLLNKPTGDSKFFEPGDDSHISKFRKMLEDASKYFDFTTFGELASNPSFLNQSVSKHLSQEQASLMTREPYKKAIQNAEQKMSSSTKKLKDIFGIVIGGMRCGSTAAFKTLTQHPEVCPAVKKEVHFFSSEENWAKGVDWYKNQWPSFDPEKHNVKVEATTHYSKFPVHKDVPERMASLNEDVRIIYSVRDPIERMESHMTFQLTKGYLKPEDRSKFLKGTALKYSMYHFQISQYLKFFSKDKIHIVVQEQMKNSPENVYPALYKHLSIDDRFMPKKTIVNGREHYIQNSEAKVNSESYKLTEEEKSLVFEAIKDDIDIFVKEFDVDVSHWKSYRGLQQ